MRKFLLATALTGLLGTSVALAIPSSGTIVVNKTPGSQYSDGGQFTAVVNGNPALTFQTFCIEIYYEFSPGTTYNYTLGQTTHVPLKPPTASPFLTLGAAWLFSQFTAGDFGLSLTSTQAGELQCALWYFQGQGANPNGDFSGPGFLDGKPGNFYTDAADTALALLGLNPFDASAGRFGVDIVQSSTVTGAPAQDWLHVPDGGATVMLLGVGLMSLVLVSRKFAAAR